MSYFVVDVESDGPIPGFYSMVCFGAVKVDKELKNTFYGKTKPMFNKFDPKALAVSGFTRKEHEKFGEPYDIMKQFATWINEVNDENTSPIFFSDNLAYDWSFINWYLHYFNNSNPFGWSGRRISDLWCGYKNNMREQWKYMRKTKHSHNPVDDAVGNAEALLEMQKQGLNLKIR